MAPSVRVALLGSLLGYSSAVAPSCDLRKPAEEVCESYCNSECGFQLPEESGAVQNITMWRLTPANLTGLRNKNSGDGPGDVSFYLEKISTFAICAQYPNFPLCVGGNADDDIYGQMDIEIDGQLGPYQECNPTLMEPGSPRNWTDVQNYQCGQYCFSPTVEEGCTTQPPPAYRRNGTTPLGDHPLAYNCFCDTTKREIKAVGRERRLPSMNQSNMSISWRNLGGSWYSTPSAGECPEGKSVGTNGCTWRVTKDFYKKASCVNQKISDAIELEYGDSCFNKYCPQPLNRTSVCYYACYKLALEGNESMGLKAITTEQIVTPWLNAFKEDDPKLGGCPKVQPAPCEGDQCDPLVSRLDFESGIAVESMLV